MWVLGGLCVVLFTLNVYFIKRLVDKLYEVETTVVQLRQELAVLTAIYENDRKKR